MKTFYVTAGIIRYRVTVKPIQTNSNYNTSISIKMVGERFPACETIVKENDNHRDIAKKVIQTWVKN